MNDSDFITWWIDFGFVYLYLQFSLIVVHGCAYRKKIFRLKLKNSVVLCTVMHIEKFTFTRPLAFCLFERMRSSGLGESNRTLWKCVMHWIFIDFGAIRNHVKWCWNWRILFEHNMQINTSQCWLWEKSMLLWCVELISISNLYVLHHVLKTFNEHIKTML